MSDLFIIPGIWKVDHRYVWAICSLSQEFGKLTSVFCGNLFIIPGVWKVGQCYLGNLFVIPRVWKVGHCCLWAICLLTQEFGKLAIVICGRFVHYPRSLKSWPLLSVGDLFIIRGVWQFGHCYLWAIFSLSHEFGMLAIVICGRFFHYPGHLGS